MSTLSDVWYEEMHEALALSAEAVDNYNKFYNIKWRGKPEGCADFIRRDGTFVWEANYRDDDPFEMSSEDVLRFSNEHFPETEKQIRQQWKDQQAAQKKQENALKRKALAQKRAEDLKTYNRLKKEFEGS